VKKAHQSRSNIKVVVVVVVMMMMMIIVFCDLDGIVRAEFVHGEL